jgi:hypothetical protein
MRNPIMHQEGDKGIRLQILRLTGYGRSGHDDDRCWGIRGVGKIGVVHQRHVRNVV